MQFLFRFVFLVKFFLDFKIIDETDSEIFRFVYFDFQKKVIEFEKQCVWKRRNLVTSVEKEKKSILSILIAIYTNYKGEKSKYIIFLYKMSNLSRPFLGHT